MKLIRTGAKFLPVPAGWPKYFGASRPCSWAYPTFGGFVWPKFPSEMAGRAGRASPLSPMPSSGNERGFVSSHSAAASLFQPVNWAVNKEPEVASIRPDTGHPLSLGFPSSRRIKPYLRRPMCSKPV